MAGGKVVGALIAGVVAGVIFSPAGVPETKVIKVHAPEKIITHKEVKTITAPIPESCETAIDYAGFLVNQTNGNQNKAKEFYQYIDELDERKLSDSNAAHETEIKLQDMLSSLDEKNYTGLGIESTAKTFWTVCQQEIKKANKGDDVQPADGVHVKSP